ncbi:MAG: putative amidohydrolase [Halieaceae bacterium]|jgi:predicted amidohydrolase
MLILSQSSWSSQNIDAGLIEELQAARKSADRRTLDQAAHLVLLPHDASALQVGAPSPDHLLEKLAEVARDCRVYLAGSTLVHVIGSDAPQAMGFLLSDQGEELLRVFKVSPELVAGFEDTTCALADAPDFPVARTPIGQIALLVGEDICFAQFSRALTFNGAEIILNPSAERSDELFEIRQCSRMGRACENAAFVAVSNPTTSVCDGVETRNPTGTALYNWMGVQVRARGNEDFVYADFDIHWLRRTRSNPGRSMPAFVRANLYGTVYRQQLAAKSAEGPKAATPTTADGWRKEATRRLEARRAQAKSDVQYEAQYEAILAQTCARLIPLDRSVNAQEIIEKNLDDGLELAGSRANIPSVRLVVFPEFWLTGPGGIGGVNRTVEDMERLAISYPGPVFDRISEFAQKHGVYVAFQNFELDPKFEHRVFNSAFLIDDSGNLVHTYRKIQCADVWGLLPDTTPGSILTEYLDVFGNDALFPVADTPLGKIANMICFDQMIPEVAHGLRCAGAEIILHSSSEPHVGPGREVWDNARLLRAFENTCYVLAAIDGGEHASHDSEIQTYFRRGHTRVISYTGEVDGVADGPGPIAFRAPVDLRALRRARMNPFNNFSLWDDPALYVSNYMQNVGMPNDLWAGDPLENPYAGVKVILETLKDYERRGIYVSPGHTVNGGIPDAV